MCIIAFINYSLQRLRTNKFTASLAYTLLYGLGRSLRWRVINENFFLDLIQKKSPVILASWHGDLLFMPYLYRYYYNQHNLTAMVSRSNDGVLIGNVLKKFDMQMSWGSSRRYGVSAFLGLEKDLSQGRWVCLTPDGPRGPRHKVQKGVLMLSQVSGCPILPIGYDFIWKKEVSSWDKMKIPYPGSKAFLKFGQTLTVPPKLSHQEEQDYIRLLEERLMDVTKPIKEM